MIDHTDHNRLAAQMAERQREEFVATRTAELALFEKRAKGELPHQSKPIHTAAPAASVAIKEQAPMSNLRLLRPAEISSAFLKAGFMGFQGSGKTKTASLTAIGLVRHLRTLNLPYADRPVAFLDSETGSDWVIPDFKEANIELATMKSRSFADLNLVIDEAVQGCSVLIVDSATHYWKELCESYQKKRAADLKKQTYRLQFQDWAWLKSEWAKFTDKFVNAPLHMIICGRAGFEYDYIEDDGGSKNLEKTGMKMKAEGEFGFEPSLLVQMELCQKIEGKAVASVWREAHVVKDRSTLIDGKTFIFHGNTDNGERLPLDTMVKQAWVSFSPHISRLNLGGRHLGVDMTRTSEHTVVTERKDWSSSQRKIVLGEIQDLLIMHVGGQALADKQKRITLLKDCFGKGWVEIEEFMGIDDLRAGYDLLHEQLTGQPSQYGSAIKADKTAAAAVMNDALPDFAAAAG